MHIVTLEENYAAMPAKGDYSDAGIDLLPWTSLAPERKSALWKKMLRGKVANAERFSRGR